VVEADAVRYRRNLQGEVDGSFLYNRLAQLEKDPALAGLYRRLGESEQRHAALWGKRLTDLGEEGVADPSRRARFLSWLAGRLGPGLLVQVLAGTERRSRKDYDNQPEAAGSPLPADERSHARLLTALEGSGGMEGARIARFEGRHRAVGGNALRAAVLGANDGLVSNLSLVMGVAGATEGGRGVLIAGLAGLLAGGFSMALGEWLSVQSSRELYEEQIAVEREELDMAPQEEEAELALIYQAKGIPEELARRLAAQVIASPGAALDTLAREELGVDPDTLGGSAWEAAVASFLLFCLGAVVPVFAFFFTSGVGAVMASLAVSALALFGVGAGITLVTGKSAWRSGLRQTLFGLVAAGVTFGIGTLLGAAISG
jgi:VIT1/CCC1 family predicted Fe2+/Mn2+ transporter